tara:strand:+ start:427 stop:564 length:138 start_codon:yes stop_codon:yes gene_type:complete
MGDDDNKTFKGSVKCFVKDAIRATTGSAIIMVLAVLIAEFIFSLP